MSDIYKNEKHRGGRSAGEWSGRVGRNKPHIAKDERFPRTYKEVAKVLIEVKTRKKSIRNAVHSNKSPRAFLNKVMGLSHNVLKNLPIITKIIEETNLLGRETNMKLENAEVMIHELIIRNNPLHGQSKPVVTLMQYETELRKAYKMILKRDGPPSTTTLIKIPKYVRINTLVTSVSDVITWFSCNGFKEVQFKSDMSLEGYYKLVKDLKSDEFVKDYHFEDVLAFTQGINFSSFSLYIDGHIFLQDKSSYIPVHLLKPQQESTVLDCCAAPGMKTSHISAVMNNKGKVIALDQDAERFNMLEETLHYGHVKNCVAKCMDFLKADPSSDEYSDVRYILLDPSCSGSGMVSRMNSITDAFFDKGEERIQKLSGFQIMLLKHAMTFPKVKRIVYSTCSIHTEENEYVIQEAMQHFSKLFKIVPAFPEWPIRGSDQYSFGSLCVRATPKNTLTNGFFVAVIDRIKNKKRKREKFEENYE